MPIGHPERSAGRTSRAGAISLGAALLCASLAGLAYPAMAQQPAAKAPSATPGPAKPRAGVQDEDVLTGTLLTVKQTGEVRIGYREASVPFSYVDRSGHPIGYSIELCQAIVEEIGQTIDSQSVRVNYVKVSPDERIPAVVDKRIDLECGSTTANAERRKSVDFSPMIFVTGTKVMVPAAAKWTTFRQLEGKKIGVSHGTTNEQTLQDLAKKFGLKFEIVQVTDHEQGFEALEAGRVDGYASDEVLLYGLIAKHGAGKKYKIAGELLSYEPYSVMFRRDDPQLRSAVARAFQKLVTDRDFAPLYQKWFMSRLPGGERLNIPMSPQLEQSLELLRPGSEPN
jgi:glutamate/aspartate transport system substrate-binding protein